MGRSRYTIYENQVPHFLTCTINNWIPIFTRPAIVQVILMHWPIVKSNAA